MITLTLRDLAVGYDLPIVTAVGEVRGERIAIVGENGSGKTTLLRTLGGVLSPVGGSFHISASKRSYAGHRPATFPGLSVEQCLEYWARLLAADRLAWQERARRVLDWFGMEGLLQAECGRLSRGQHQLVSLTVSLAANPEVVIWDEPTSGLDRSRCATLWQTVEALRTGQPDEWALRGVIFTTHLVDDLVGASVLRVHEGAASPVPREEAYRWVEALLRDEKARTSPGSYRSALARYRDGERGGADAWR